MRSSLILAAVLGAFVSTTAFAATGQTDTGVIKTINTKAHQIRLADGKWFVLPKKFSVKTLKVGEKVTVNYTMNHKRMLATSVKAAS